MHLSLVLVKWMWDTKWRATLLWGTSFLDAVKLLLLNFAITDLEDVYHKKDEVSVTTLPFYSCLRDGRSSSSIVCWFPWIKFCLQAWTLWFSYENLKTSGCFQWLMSPKNVIKFQLMMLLLYCWVNGVSRAILLPCSELRSVEFSFRFCCETWNSHWPFRSFSLCLHRMRKVIEKSSNNCLGDWGYNNFEIMKGKWQFMLTEVKNLGYIENRDAILNLLYMLRPVILNLTGACGHAIGVVFTQGQDLVYSVSTSSISCKTRFIVFERQIHSFSYPERKLRSFLMHDLSFWGYAMRRFFVFWKHWASCWGFSYLVELTSWMTRHVKQVDRTSSGMSLDKRPAGIFSLEGKRPLTEARWKWESAPRWLQKIPTSLPLA